MKEFSHDEFKKNELCKIILEVAHKELCNSTYNPYFKNIKYDDVLKVLNRIFNEYYLIFNKKESVIEFKERLKNYKTSCIIGSIEIKSKDVEKESISHTSFNSEYVIYSVLNNWLFLRAYNDEIGDSDQTSKRIYDLLSVNYKELDVNPVNVFVARPLSNVFRNGEFGNSDVKDYVQLLLDEIKEFEEEQKIKNPPFKDEIIKNKGLPKYNLPQRLYLLEKLKLLKVIKESTDDEKIRIELLAIILNINKDNSRKLLSGTYGRVKHGDQNEIDNYVNYYKIGIIE